MKRKAKTIKLTRGGQITLPKEVREQYKIYEGDLLELEVTTEGFWIRPVVTHYKRLGMQDLVDLTEKQVKEGNYTAINSESELEDFLNGL